LPASCRRPDEKLISHYISDACQYANDCFVTHPHYPCRETGGTTVIASIHAAGTAFPADAGNVSGQPHNKQARVHECPENIPAGLVNLPDLG
jgi:hypothetical protein